ncbi:MAG: LamG-like jellyroll fold domain-containing protein [Bacteroidales bacterium]
MKKYYSILCFIIIFILFGNKNIIFAQCNNVALGKPATASNYAVWAGAIPGAAVDGDCSNEWNAGTFAPQYWQVDLLSNYTVNNINIMFDMTPDGNVYHQILTSPDMITWTVVDTMVGYYYTNQLIERCYSAAPLTNVRGVRVNTLTSPSWVAIKDLGVYILSTQTQPTIASSGSLTFCQGDSVTLTSSVAGTYQWSNGATTQSITVGSSGNYTVITNPVPICIQGSMPCTSCGYGTASATVIVNPKPLVNLGNDTTLTQGSTLQLNAGNTGSTYLWSTSDTTQTITVNTNGTYWAKVTNSGGCFSSDTINVNVNSTPFNCVNVQPISTFPIVGDAPITSYKTINNKIYLFGLLVPPYTTNWVCSNRTRTFDVVTHTWDSLISNLPYGTFGNSPAAYNNNHFYYAPSWETGGSNGFGIRKKMVDVDLINNTAIETSHQFSSGNIWGISSIEVNGKIYFFGGWNGSATNSIFELNPTTNSFQQVASFANARTLVTAVLGNDGWIYCIGFPQSTIERFNPNTHQVQTMSATTTSNVYCLNFWHISTENSIYYFSEDVNPTIYKYDYSADVVSSTGMTLSGSYARRSIIDNNDPYSIYGFKYNPDRNSPLQLLKLTLGTIPTVNLGNDTTLTQGSTLNLNAGNAGCTYLWSTGATTQTLSVNTSGTYWVKVTNSGGCFNSDTINISLTTSSNPLNDTIICKGENVILTANATAIGSSWLYFQDFENTVGNEWNNNNRFTFNGTKVAGPFGNQSISLNLSNLPQHDSVEVSFDLYIHDSWDGNGPTSFDYWNLLINNDTLISTTFSNHTTQSYPQNYPANNPFKTGALITNLPVLCSNSVGSSMYRITRKILNNSNLLLISFKGNTDQSVCDESWSIDNVKVKLLNVSSTQQYLWSTGATTAAINVSPNQTTTYTVTVTNGSTTFIDSSTVYVLNPQINNGQDTTICKGESITLTASGLIGNGTWEYFQDFENNVVSEWNTHGTNNFNGTKVLGPVIDTTIKLTLQSLPAHDSVEISFDLYIHDSWDGNQLYNPTHVGPDIFIFTINNDTVLNTTFSNVVGYPQSYPSNYLLANNLYKTGSFLPNLPGIPGYGTSLYKLSYLLPNNSNLLNLKFIDKTITSQSGHIIEESWSIDNVKVKLLNTSSSSFLWSTNETTQSITVTPSQTSNYTLTITNGNISCMDTITVNVLNPQINSGTDTTICKGETVVLTANTSSQNACNKTQLPANLQQGLVAFYPFCGNANDESGNGNNGVVNGAILTTDRFGNANSAYSFDGVNNNIITPISSWVGNAITFCAWFKLKVIPPELYGIVCSRTAIGQESGLDVGSTNIWFDVIQEPQSLIFPIQSDTVNWHFMVGTYNNGLMNLYFDNQFVASQTASTNFYINQPIKIGYDGCPGYSRFFNGSIDEVSIYNRALSSSEVNQLYNLGSSNATASMFQWSTNDTTQSITVTPTQTTNYALTVTNGNISCMDTIMVNVLNPQINNGADTTICKGESVILNTNSFCNKSQLPINLQQGLLVYYPFCGNANDESGNGHDGTVNGATLTTDRFGNLNSAFNFNGLNNYIIASNINFPSSNSSRTISAWVKFNTISNNPTIIAYGKNIDSKQFAVRSVVNKWCLNLWNTGSYLDVFSNNVPPLNNWIHVVMLYDHDSKTAKIIENSITVGSQILTVEPTTQLSDSGLTIGKINEIWGGAYYFMDGKIDDIHIYNRVLSTTEIQQLFYLGTASSSLSSYLWSTNDTTQSITATPPLTTNYSVNITNGTKTCSDTSTIYVINIEAGANDSICKGDSVQLQASGGLIYNWLPTIGLNNPNIANPFAHPMQTTTYYVNAQSQGYNLIYNGNFEMGNIGFTSSHNYSTNLGPQGLYCIGNNPQTYHPGFSSCPDHTTGSGNMMIINGATTPNEIVWSQTIQIQKNKNYTFSAWVQNVSSSTTVLAQLQFKINGILIGPVFTCPSSNQCYWGNFYTQWFSGNDSIITISILNQNTQAGGNDFCLDDIYFSELKTCSDSVKVTVINPTQINLGNDTTICQGQSKMLSAGNVYNSYLWSTGATTSQITVLNTGSYWVKAITNLGCIVKDTINLTFLPVQSNVIRDSILCPGQNLILSPGLGFTNHQWSTGAVTSSLAVSLPGLYWVQAKQANGCTIRDTAIIKIDSINLSIASFVNPACFGGNNGSINTTVNSLYPPFTYSWNTTPVQTTQNLSNLTAGNYTLTLTDNLGCSKTLSQTLSNPSPVSVSLGNDTSFCQGKSLILQPTQSFSSYLWSTFATTQTISVNSQGTYWLKVINAAGCSGYDTVNVTMNPTPVVQITPSNPSICKGESIILTVSSNLALTTFVWSNLATTTTINISPTVTSSYFVVGKINQCEDTAFVSLTIKPLPVIATSADKNPLCEGETVNLTAVSDIPSTTYVWNNNTTGNTLTVNPLSSTYYYVTGTANNCQDTSGITINVIQKQIVNLGEDSYLCAGDEINLSVNNLTGSYMWSDGSNSNTITAKEPGFYWIRVDNNGCIASDSIEFKKCSEIWVPNVFTPNGDAINDVFKATTKEISNLQMMIYNRWGSLIFETQDINSGWDGKYAGGDAQSGVYYWVIKYTENRTFSKLVEKEIHGSVTLLR